MRRTDTGRCHPYLVWVDATPDGSNTLISAYLLLYDDDHYSYDERDKALTSHGKGRWSATSYPEDPPHLTCSHTCNAPRDWSATRTEPRRNHCTPTDILHL